MQAIELALFTKKELITLKVKDYFTNIRELLRLFWLKNAFETIDCNLHQDFIQ